MALTLWWLLTNCSDIWFPYPTNLGTPSNSISSIVSKVLVVFSYLIQEISAAYKGRIMSPWYIWENDNYHIIYNLGFLIPSFVTGNRERQKLSLGVWGSYSNSFFFAESQNVPKNRVCSIFICKQTHTPIPNTHTHTHTHTPHTQ